MLEKLTPEQEARLSEFCDFGLRIGLSTERTDQTAADAAIRAHYRACGLDEPKEIRWFDSPYASVRESVGENVGKSIGKNVRENVWTIIRDSVRENVWKNVWGSVGESVRDSVRESVRDSVWDSVWGSVGESVRGSVRDSVGGSVWESVGGSVWGSVRGSVRDSVGESVGAHFDADDTAWMLAWDQYGVSLPQSAHTFIKFNELVWWCYPGKDIVFASDRPTAIRRDNDGQLHCETGKAIEFADGTGFSTWHGQTIPDEWVTGSPPSAAEALQWRNMDQRAAACEIIGWHHILDELGARTIDADPDPMIGTLVVVQLPDHGPQKMLDCLCGTGRRFALLAPDEATTALHAQSLLNDVPEDIIKTLKVRT